MNKQVENRMRRLEGQLHKLRHTIEHDADCTDVIPQFLAVKGALSAAFTLYVQESMEACSISDKEKLAKLITLLTKA